MGTRNACKDFTNSTITFYLNNIKIPKAITLMFPKNYIDGNASKRRIMIFDENEIFMEMYFDTSLYKSVNDLYQNSNAKTTKMAKIEVENTHSPVCFKTVFCVS